MKDSEDAKEAFSRTIFRATTNLQRQADEIADPRAWLLAIAYRVCMDLYRERSRHPDGRLEEVMPRSREWEPAHGGDPERAILDKELEAVLCEAIETLPARLGGALRAYLSTGSYRDIAEQFGITEVNARKRIQEARVILRRRLDAYRSGRPAPDKPRRAGAHIGRGCLLDDSTPGT